MQNLKSSFPYSLILFLLAFMPNESNAQLKYTNTHVTAVVASTLLNNSKMFDATASTSIMFIDTQPNVPALSPSIMFTDSNMDNTAKDFSIPHYNSERAMIKVAATEVCKTSALSTNLPFRFPSLNLKLAIGK